MAEGARLLIECGVKALPRVQIPPSPFSYAPLAQLDRASGYGPEGQEFESLRVYSLKKMPLFRGIFHFYGLEVAF